MRSCKPSAGSSGMSGSKRASEIVSPSRLTEGRCCNRGGHNGTGARHPPPSSNPRGAAPRASGTPP
eukprot:11181961-Lingulodinium_polyedra.AAC.1